MAGRFAWFVSGVALVGLASACSDAPSGQIVFGPEGNELNAYSTGDDIVKQTVIPSSDADPNGRDINGQVCFAPDGSRVFVAGEDTGQPNPPAGFGLFRLSGSEVGSLSAVQIGKLTPTYPGAETSIPDPYGCSFLGDGRLITSDIGNNQTGPPNGQVIVWFPPLDVANPSYCKIDVAVGTAGQVYVDGEDRVYVTSSRSQPGVIRYSHLPTSADASGGCGATDETGAPLSLSVVREQFIKADANLPTVNGIAGTAVGTLYVSSVLSGVIAEYDAEGKFVRRILEPPAGETIGFDPYTTGTPLGIAVDRSGTVYYADLGLVFRNGRFGPGPRTGTVRRIRFDGDVPQAPEIMDAGLRFPDAVAVYTP